MKKLYTTLMVLLLAAVVPTLFVSCDWDDDDEIAYTLEGTWRGDMEVYSSWNGRIYDATRTEITFLRDPYTYSSGDGYWVDFYSGAPWDYVANHITWRVDFGDIVVWFREEGTTVRIRDYRLNNDHFRGWLQDGENDVKFDLIHISSPNWSYYDHWGYDSWYDDRYWARTRTAADDDSAAVTEKPIRHIGK